MQHLCTVYGYNDVLRLMCKVPVYFEQLQESKVYNFMGVSIFPGIFGVEGRKMRGGGV